LRDRHHCLLLRFPGANEFHWTLNEPKGPKRYEVSGPFESDDGDVLTDWALAGAGIVNKPRFEVEEHLASGRLVEVCRETPPLAVRLACLYPHKRYEDPKIRIFADFVAERCRAALARTGRAPGTDGG
jgi:DNA-binding transcriptional LysR family regulator